MLPITPTTTFTKIAKLKGTVRIVQGGTSAGKTYSILQYLIIYALKRTLLISVVAESVPVLKRGAYKDFIDILMSMGIYDEKCHNKTDRKYKLNNSTFEFFSVDDSAKLRGARRDILFLNEANNIKFDSFFQLNIRTKLFTYLDFNPTTEFYAHTELLNQKDTDFVIVTFRDNEYLDEKIRKEIQSWEAKSLTSDFWLNIWRVYGLGQIGQQQGAIFTDWTEIESLPIGARLIGSGMDFGFSPDPTTLISVYEYNNEIIVDEVLYECGLFNKQIAAKIKESDAINGLILADCAQPMSIAELKTYGINIIGQPKGKGSINYGISLIQQQHFKVTSCSKNLIKELQNYTWQKDKDGKDLSIPIDAYNHCCDALRYLFLNKFCKKIKTFNLKWKK